MASRENFENEKRSCKAWCESAENWCCCASTYLDFQEIGCTTNPILTLLNSFLADIIAEIKKVSAVGYSSKMRKSQFYLPADLKLQQKQGIFEKYLPEKGRQKRLEMSWQKLLEMSRQKCPKWADRSGPNRANKSFLKWAGRSYPKWADKSCPKWVGRT